MQNVLDRQIRSYEQSALQAAHDEAMACRDVEDLIDVGLGLFDSVKNSVRRWQVRQAGGGEEFSLQVAQEFVSLYRGLGTAFDLIEQAAGRMRQNGYAVAGW